MTMYRMISDRSVSDFREWLKTMPKMDLAQDSRGGAFDVAPRRRKRMARDYQLADFGAFCDCLKSHGFTDSEIREALAIVAGPGVAKDQPLPFSGRPRPGGAMDPIKSITGDSALARLYPGIERIITVDADRERRSSLGSVETCKSACLRQDD